jgi:hypothetical protein
MRGPAILALSAVIACTACGILANIEDITVVDPDLADGGRPRPKEDGATPDIDSSGPGVDAAPDVLVDAGADADASTRCDAKAPFGAPVAVAELNSPEDDSTVRLSADELTAYFGSVRAGHIGAASVYRATRTSATGTFGTPGLMPNVNSNTGAIYHPAITGNNLQLFLQVDFGGASGTDIYLATRASTLVEFGTPGLVANVNSNGFEFIPFVTADGVDLFFASNRSGSFVLYRSTVAGGVFGAPTVLPGTASADTTVRDTAPVMSADRLTVYFASTRINPGTPNVYHVFVARRANPSASFDPPTAVTELNDLTAGISDSPSWISADDCRLYMSSTRPNAAGGKFDVYLAKRAP